MTAMVAPPADGQEPPLDAAAGFDARVAEWERELADEAASAAWAIASDQAELAAEVAADPALAVALGWAPDPHRDPWHADGGGPRSHEGQGAPTGEPATRVPVDELSDFALVERVAEVERQVAALQAEQAHAMVVLARRSVFRRADGDVPAGTRRRVDTVEERCERAAYELSAALTVAPQTAANRLAVSLELVERMPATLAALAAGRLSWQRARVLATETRPLPPQARAAVERQALGEVDALTPGQLERRVRRWVIAADPRGAEARHAAARRQRGFRISALADGMAELRAVLAADAAQLVATAVDAVAESLRRQDDLDAAAARTTSSGDGRTDAPRDGVGGPEPDRRTADQRRADALTTICADVLAAGHTGCAHPVCGDACSHGAGRIETGGGSPSAAGNGNGDGNGAGEPAAALGVHGEGLVPGDAARSGIPRPRRPVTDPPNGPLPVPLEDPPGGGAGEPEPDPPEPDQAEPGPSEPDPTESDPSGTDPSGTDPSGTDPEPDPEPDPPEASTPSTPPEPPTQRAPAAGLPRRGPEDDRRRSGSRLHEERQPAGAGEQRRVRLARWHGHRPHVQVTVAATTLLGFDDLPGYLAGYGPVTADQARRIAASGTWRRLLTDPASGRLLDYGRTRRDPPADLADFVMARDVTCRFPTSLVPAARCDLDHARPWASGGRTDRDNVHALSGRAHQVRHDARWTVFPDSGNGSVSWVSATGHRYVTPASQVGPVPADRLLASLPRWADPTECDRGGAGATGQREEATSGDAGAGRGAPGDIPPC